MYPRAEKYIEHPVGLFLIDSHSNGTQGRQIDRTPCSVISNRLIF